MAKVESGKQQNGLNLYDKNRWVPQERQIDRRTDRLKNLVTYSAPLQPAAHVQAPDMWSHTPPAK